MLFKNVLSLSAAVLMTSQAYAKGPKQQVITLGQKSMLTQLCLEGRFNKEGNENLKLLNTVLNSNIKGEGGMSAPQGNLVISDGKGKYALVAMVSQSSFGSERLKKGQNPDSARTGSVSQTEYTITLLEHGELTSTVLTVTDFATGINAGESVQFCRVGTVSSNLLKDDKANIISLILDHREMFHDSKTTEAAKASLERVSKAGKTKLNAQELAVMNELLFGAVSSQENSESARTGAALADYASDVRSKENLAKQQGKTTQEADAEPTEVSTREELVKNSKLNFAAMRAAVIKVGFEAVGKKEMFIGENEIAAEGEGEEKYRASGAKTHPLLRMVRDKRVLDIVIVK